MAFARWAKVPTLSCIDDGRAADTRPHSNGCCGQRKIPFSLLPDHVTIESDNCLCVPLDLLRRHQQAILVKRHRDPFTNPKFDRLLTEVPTQRFYVFGVALESSIRLLVLGLLLRERHVTLVHDACGYWNPNDADMALRQLLAKGCEIASSEQVVRDALGRMKAHARRGLRRRRFVA
jgi:hypothetical protein